MKKYDAIVIGAGIAGMQCAVDLANQDYQVLLIEKKSSIGGTMIQLSKVFPTLDCASCITTPKMSETYKHPNITTMTLAEVTKIERRDDDRFTVKIHERPRYVHLDPCTGCNECAEVCPVYVIDDYDMNLGIRKAVGVPFANALPPKAVLHEDECIFCGRCATVCPTDAIDYSMLPQDHEFDAGTVILATGLLETPIIKEEYGGGQFKNVITGKQMERILAPHGPYGGIMRPSDGKLPLSIAYIQCAGSRDLSIGIPYCSRVCCMYAAKQAMLLSAAAPLADITIYYMDIRAFGKGYEEFVEDAKAMGVSFIRGKVAKITEKENGDLTVRIEVFDEDGGIREFDHELVVLSIGLVPKWNPKGIVDVAMDQYGFIRSANPNENPSATNIPGVYVAGVANGPMDIVDSIKSGSAAAMKASIYLNGGAREPAKVVKLVEIETK